MKSFFSFSLKKARDGTGHIGLGHMDSYAFDLSIGADHRGGHLASS